MKKILLSLIFAAATLSIVNAQKGTILVGGDVTYASYKTSFENSNPDNTASALSFNPMAGYQFTVNITVGITATIISNKNYSSDSEDKQNIFSAGPFVRYTKKLSDLFSVYGQLQATFGSGKTIHSGSFDEESKNSSSEITFFPALFINIKKGFGLNFNIGAIGYNATKQDGYGTQKIFVFGFGKSLTIGISKNF